MPCKLGLYNTDQEGNIIEGGITGQYEGNGIARTLKRIYLKMEEDGFNSDNPEIPKPRIVFTYSDEKFKTFTGEAEDVFLPIELIMEKDSDFRDISCFGFGPKGYMAGNESCEDCPYLLRPTRSD